MEKLLELVRELVPAAIWSAGVELARTSEVVEVPSMNAGERSFRIVQGPQDKAITVALSDEDQAWQSDCACPDDPCRHVVGTVLALKQGKLSTGPFRRPGAFLRRRKIVRMLRSSTRLRCGGGGGPAAVGGIGCEVGGFRLRLDPWYLCAKHPAPGL